MSPDLNDDESTLVLVPLGNNSLPEPKFMQIHVAKWRVTTPRRVNKTTEIITFDSLRWFLSHNLKLMNLYLKYVSLFWVQFIQCILTPFIPIAIQVKACKIQQELRTMSLQKLYAKFNNNQSSSFWVIMLILYICLSIFHCKRLWILKMICVNLFRYPRSIEEGDICRSKIVSASL